MKLLLLKTTRMMASMLTHSPCCLVSLAGRRFAEQEMFVFIVKLLQNYRVTWSSKQPMEQKYEMLLRPDVPAQFRLDPRNWKHEKDFGT